MNSKRLDAPSFAALTALITCLLVASPSRSHAQAPDPDVIFMPESQVWNYYQERDEPADIGGKTWKEVGYDDTAWDSGPAELGFDSAANSETTTLLRGAVTYYFRTTVQVTQQQLNNANQLIMQVVRDDGIVIYVNGVEHRDNMPDSTAVPVVSYETVALSPVAGSDESLKRPVNFLSGDLLNVGANTIAVEAHQNSPGSSDISFSLEMQGFNVIPILGSYVPPAPINFDNSFANDDQYSSIEGSFFNDPFELGWLLTSASGRSSVHFVHPELEEPDPGGFTEGICLIATRGSVEMVTDVWEEPDHDDFGEEGAYRVNLSNYKDVTVQFGLRAYDHLGTGLTTSTTARAWLETSFDGTLFDSDEVLNITGGEGSGMIQSLVSDSDTKTVLVPTSDIGSSWQLVGFDDASWTSGTKAAGYDRGTTYNPYFGSTLNLRSQLDGVNGTLYMRVPFNVTDKSGFQKLFLNMRYDDGFVAYINGNEVARANASGSPPAYNAEGSGNHSDSSAVVWQVFDITNHLDDVDIGDNILAIHGLNRPKTSSDMLTGVELQALIVGGGGGGPTGEPESLEDIVGPLDGPFTVFKYDVADNAQTLRMRFALNCNRNDSALMLDNILVSGTPLTVQSYADWIQITTDFELDDQGQPELDPEGDGLSNLLDYAFGGSATEPDTGITPTAEIIEIEGINYLAMTWRQLNLTTTGTLEGPFTGSYTVRDVTYVPQWSTDGQFWRDAMPGPTAFILLEEFEGEGETVEVTARVVDPILQGTETERIFARIKVILDEQ